MLRVFQHRRKMATANFMVEPIAEGFEIDIRRIHCVEEFCAGVSARVGMASVTGGAAAAGNDA